MSRAPKFSAKGATFMSNLGQRPTVSGNAKSPALKARFFPAAIGVRLTENRWFESRFQRFFISQLEPWGDAQAGMRARFQR
jgi:hypothetical protein